MAIDVKHTPQLMSCETRMLTRSRKPQQKLRPQTCGGDWTGQRRDPGSQADLDVDNQDSLDQGKAAALDQGEQTGRFVSGKDATTFADEDRTRRPSLLLWREKTFDMAALGSFLRDQKEKQERFRCLWHDMRQERQKDLERIQCERRMNETGINRLDNSHIEKIGRWPPPPVPIPRSISRYSPTLCKRFQRNHSASRQWRLKHERQERRDAYINMTRSDQLYHNNTKNNPEKPTDRFDVIVANRPQTTSAEDRGLPPELMRMTSNKSLMSVDRSTCDSRIQKRYSELSLYEDPGRSLREEPNAVNESGSVRIAGSNVILDRVIVRQSSRSAIETRKNKPGW